MVNYGLTIVLIVDISIEVFSVYQQGTLLKSIGSAALQIQRTWKRFLEHAGGAQTVKKRGLDGWQHRSMAGFQQAIYFGGYPKMMSLVDTNFPVAVHLLFPSTLQPWVSMSHRSGTPEHAGELIFGAWWEAAPSLHSQLGRSYVHQCIFTLDPED